MLGEGERTRERMARERGGERERVTVQGENIMFVRLGAWNEGERGRLEPLSVGVEGRKRVE